MTKPGFIHITKTGGACVKKNILKNYKDDFLLDGFKEKFHDLDSSFFEKPFVIVRDPVDRFFSLYSYWRYGSEVFKENIPDYTISDFIYFLDNNDCALNTSITWIDFFRPQSSWIKREDYKKTVVIVYKKDLSESFDKLLNYFDIPVRHSSLCKFNVTEHKANQIGFYYFAKNLRKFVESKYHSDFELYNDILNNPSLFKQVI